MLRDESDNLGSRLDDGSLDGEDFRTGIVLVLSDLRSLVDYVEPPSDCPDWCNDHITHLDLEPEEDASSCRLHVEGNGWLFDVQEAVGEDDMVLVPSDSSEMSLSQARAYAAAILSACDATQGSATSPMDTD
ncbi:hypothetical protein [uncultured Phycicoccus sp.]|uniref:hypothetical protein n=1 Tax=uncultured Phycicoccus sp. TaxID=661422 RepID=UPI0026281AA9|nr:hypothetical protein [uncultured Phycicoccus sp.]